MRLFVAVYPPPAALDDLAAGVPALPPMWRPVPREHWHVTVAFLGEVPEARLDELGERLGRAAGRSTAATVRLAGAGAFRSRHQASVLWAGVAGEPPALAGLARLADRVGAAARRAGVDLAARRYHPHLTLARCRAARGVDAGEVLDLLAGLSGPPWPVAEVVLVRSTLGAAVRHEPVGRWPLEG